MTTTTPQHPKVAQLQQRLAEARKRGDAEAQRELLAQLVRIEIRHLSAAQIAAQAEYIATQCDSRP